MSFWVGFEEILHLYVDFLGKFYGTFVNQSKLSAIGLYAKDFFEIVGAPWSEICVVFRVVSDRRLVTAP